MRLVWNAYYGRFHKLGHWALIVNEKSHRFHLALGEASDYGCFVLSFYKKGGGAIDITWRPFTKRFTRVWK